MEVIYNKKSIANNEYLKVSETQSKPQIKYISDPLKLYTLIMYDPDTVNGTYVHWIVSNIKGDDLNNGNIIIPYKGPSPPPKTGKHRYIFELYSQSSKMDRFTNQERSISIDALREKMRLSINDLLYKKQFISQNSSGGKKTKLRKKNKNNSTKRLKKRILK